MKRLKMEDEWLCAAYDEDGDEAVCDVCGEGLKWSQRRNRYFCPGCGQVMSREIFFNHIGAEPPLAKCLMGCRENYPLCKDICADMT